MKVLLSISLTLCVVLVCFAQHRSGSPSVKLPRLRQELLKRVSEDQRIRNELIRKGIDHPDPTLLDQMKKIDATNTARIKVIIKQHGWPGPKLIGRDGTDAFFLLAQHADPAFQKKVLPLVQTAYRRGILTDRVTRYLLIVCWSRAVNHKSMAPLRSRWISGTAGSQCLSRLRMKRMWTSDVRQWD